MFLFLAVIAKAYGQPNLSAREVINGLAIYPDINIRAKYYYAPIEFELARDIEGKPEFSFIRMTHLASRARGMEQWKQSSLVQFTIRKAGINRDVLKKIKNVLRDRIRNSAAFKLVPAPIKRMQAYLIYTNLDNDSTSVIQSNYQDNLKDKNSGGLWTSKVFTIRADKYTSQSLWDAFRNNKGLLSVAYGIWSRGKYKDEINYSFSGPEELEEILQSIEGSNSDTTLLESRGALINAGAFQLSVDLDKWPDLLKEISFENTLSPRYGLVDVYCYDFKNNIRPDLFGKIVEFEAQGAGKGQVTTEIEFLKDQADTYAQAVKFEYAVRLDKPLRYRVIELAESGDVEEGPWQHKENWTGIIDISSQKDFNSFFKSE